MVEIRPIPNWPGYFIDAEGNAYSEMRARPRKVLSPMNVKGYLQVRLYKGDGTSQWFLIHRLVAEVFELNKPKGAYQIRHLDGTRNNNHKDNLAWGTQWENAQDALRHNTTRRGQISGRAVFSEEEVRDIRRLARTGHTRRAIGKMYNVNHTTINGVVKYNWQHLD